MRTSHFHFNKSDIKKLARQRSYVRGEDYYEMGFVKEVIKKGNRFYGVVSGTE